MTIEIEFGAEELKAMCLERVKSFSTLTEGHFEASTGYGEPKVTLTFIGKKEEEAHVRAEEARNQRIASAAMSAETPAPVEPF